MIYIYILHYITLLHHCCRRSEHAGACCWWRLTMPLPMVWVCWTFSSTSSTARAAAILLRSCLIQSRFWTSQDVVEKDQTLSSSKFQHVPTAYRETACNPYDRSMTDIQPIPPSSTRRTRPQHSNGQIMSQRGCDPLLLDRLVVGRASRCRPRAFGVPAMGLSLLTICQADPKLLWHHWWNS